LTAAVIGVVCALRSEARCLGRALEAEDPLECLADGTLIAVTGMGAVRAAAGAQALCAAGARALLSFGMAGGLDPALRAGDVVLPAEVVTPQGAAFATAAAWRAQLYQAVGRSGGVSCGRLLTSDAAVLSPAAKAALFRECGAVAVDMESAAVADVASGAALPFMAVRAVIDAAAASVPRAVIASSAAGTGEPSVLRLLAALGRRPQDLPALLPLLSGYRVARRSLRTIARSGALQPRLPRAIHVARTA
jgi:adenosylhomocysteine nucleosidase